MNFKQPLTATDAKVDARATALTLIWCLAAEAAEEETVEVAAEVAAGTALLLNTLPLSVLLPRTCRICHR